MTYKEIIKRLRYKAKHITEKLEPSYFLECAEYLERYRWHDLRKNPNDLPTHDDFVMVAYKPLDEAKIHYTTCCYASAFWNMHTIQEWREIEPSEVTV